MNLENVLRDYALWLDGKPEGARANLYGADLREANLRGADLREADLREADLHEANLCGANLREANLTGADLREANLREANLREASLRGADLYGAGLYGVDLREANLRGADLRRTDLREADLREADLRGANLYGANLTGADLREANLTGANLTGANLTDARLPNFQIVPEEGSFIGWKRAGYAILKLEIPAEAKRTSSLVGRKCRAEFVRVLESSQPGDTFKSSRGGIYKIGETYHPDAYDDDIRIECTNGVHFFITRREAEEYEA